MDKTLRKSSQAAAVALCLSFCLTVVLGVAIGLPLWSRYTSVTNGINYEHQVGIWQYCVKSQGNRACNAMSGANNNLCKGWVAATAACAIIAVTFFFLCMILSLLILVSKKPFKTKGLRLGLFGLSFLAFLFCLLAWIFWFCFGESHSCWALTAPSPLRKYGASFIMAALGSFFAMFLVCIAALLVGLTPKPPKMAPPPVVEPVVYYETVPQVPLVEYPVAPAYEFAPAAYTAYPEVPAYQPALPAYTAPSVAAAPMYTTYY